MTGPELNAALSDLADRTDLWEVPIGGGKAIFYWGWFWRQVNWDAAQVTLAVNDDGWVGFCENNKWGYREFYIDTAPLRELCERAVTEQTADSLQALWDYMQAQGAK